MKTSVFKLGPIAVLALIMGLMFSGAAFTVQNTELAFSSDHQQQVLEWRAERDASLRQENGWLSLVGLEWLQQGKNSLGSAAENSIHIPGGPTHWGDIVLTDQGMIFTPDPKAGVLVDGVALAEAKLFADDTESPTVISHDTISIYVIFRESYGLRISDSRAPARLDFQGVENFDIQEQWLIGGQFVAAKAGQIIEIGNVLGQLLEMPVLGYFVFDYAGKSHRLAAIGDAESDSLWFIFADRTSGRETYGAGRFLYSEAMPVNGKLLVDFNKAYNPPCAFNEYSTCPLPPLENRLDLEVTAGEKNFHPVSLTSNRQ